jgi:hypothetical protein
MSQVRHALRSGSQIDPQFSKDSSRPFLNLCVYKEQPFSFKFLKTHTILRAVPVAMAWRLIGLRIEKTASKNGAKLRIY